MTGLKIETSQISKAVLVRIVDSFRPVPITDAALAKILHIEKTIEVIKIPEKQEHLDKRMKAMRVTNRSSQKRVKAYNLLADRYNALNKRGNKLLEDIKALETRYPDLKKKKKEG
ncbi:MAG: hypothetical protein MI863_16465 [Desulfobacterales bacterium]|nr:hypothetical protein [Desulfobacterales bacterium]